MLFLREEVDQLIGPGFLSPASRPGPMPVEVLIAYQRQLQARGIHFVFVPVPAKASIYPEFLYAGYPVSAGPACNKDWRPLLGRLIEAGVDVVDLHGDFWSAKEQEGEALFLKEDTHWTPHGLALASDRLAQHLQPLLGVGPRVSLSKRLQTIRVRGDLYTMLGFTPAREVTSSQTVEISQVLRNGATVETGDDEAPILLLGDSFTMAYSDGPIGEGAAGLPEQLMLRLGVGVQVIASCTGKTGGPTGVRQTLASRPKALAHKKIVILECTVRALHTGPAGWEAVPLPPEMGTDR